MIRSALAKLTLYYLGILMTLSILFSFIIYQVSSREFGRVPRPDSIRGLRQPFQYNLELLREEQERIGRRNLKRNLAILNIGTLALATGASYLLARRTLEPIEEAMEAQSRFTSDASHELRTPLTAMRSQIEVGLRDPKLKLGQAKELLQSTLEEVTKLGALSSGLLRLTRKNGDIEYEPVSLRKISIDAAAQLEVAAKLKNLNIDNKVEDLTVLGDEFSLKELVSILLDNAIKYSPQKTNIKLSSQRQGKQAVLMVTDQGQGMKASELVHIFERFYRADTSRSKERVEGYGLGLSIAKQIVDSHDGSIEATSKPGEGSTFTVKLPLA